MNADGHEDELALRTGWSGGSDGCYICFLCVAIEEENHHKENREECRHGGCYLHKDKNIWGSL